MTPDEYLRDLRDIGPAKPMGYLPLQTIGSSGKTTAKALHDELVARGLKVALCLPDDVYEKNKEKLEQLNFSQIWNADIWHPGMGVPPHMSGKPVTFCSDALYAWDEKALQALLDKNREVLVKYDWPTSPEAFVRKAWMNNIVERGELCDLIADAFGDFNNPERTKPGKPLDTVSEPAADTAPARGDGKPWAEVSKPDTGKKISRS